VCLSACRFLSNTHLECLAQTATSHLDCLSSLTKVTCLHLKAMYTDQTVYNQELTLFPSSILHMTALHRLSLSNFLFDSIPDNIGCLSQLVVLKLPSCYNMTMPAVALQQLSALAKLSLRFDFCDRWALLYIASLLHQCPKPIGSMSSALQSVS